MRVFFVNGPLEGEYREVPWHIRYILTPRLPVLPMRYDPTTAPLIPLETISYYISPTINTINYDAWGIAQ